jgi:tetratricopeptide (TPR) repeat protein
MYIRGVRVIMRSLAVFIAAVLILLASPPAKSQTATAPAKSDASSQAALEDSLNSAKQALSKGDYASAEKLLTAYVKDNPGNAEALALQGNVFLELKRSPDAEHSFLAVIKLQPSLWSAQKSLVTAYATQGKWAEFDQQRTFLQQARAKGYPGLSANDVDVIDVLYVGDDRYIVRAFAQLGGRFNNRYTFMHFGPDNKPDYWIACESDDVDQITFAKAHPQEAAAGQRSFSLDSYTGPKLAADGKSYTRTHGTIKFYPDGEPTYETVRADVWSVLEHKTNAMSTTTVGSPASSGTNAPKP